MAKARRSGKPSSSQGQRDARRRQAGDHLARQQFFAINGSPTALTNVTLALEVVHAMTSPSTTEREYYFIPHWKPGQKIFLPALCVPNVSSPELLALTAPPVTLSAAGVVEAWTQLWSDQVTQPREATKFPGHVEAIGRAQLNDAYCALGDFLRRPFGARSAPSTGAAARPNALFVGPVVLPKVTLADTTPAIVQAKAAAKQVLAFVPADSPLVAEANAFAADPQSALRDLRKRQLDDFLTAIPPQKFRTGVWALHRPGALGRLSATAARNSPNKMTLTIDTRGAAGEVTATLTNPDQANLKRKLAGRVQVDASANRLLLNLHAPPNSLRPPTEADIKLAAAWTRLLLEAHGTQLRGVAEIGAGDNPILVDIVFEPPQDVPKPAAK